MVGMVIIGTGECGVRAAFALREQGYEGTITLIGEEASLPYERPPLSKGLDISPKHIRADESYGDARISRRFGTRVAAVDRVGRTVTFADGSKLQYENLLLATGAQARLFHGLHDCLTLRSDADAADIRRRLGPNKTIGIIGGGFIGLELAATARAAGGDVTVFESGPRILGRSVPVEIAQIVHQRHKAAGVSILTQSDVVHCDGHTICLDDGTHRSFDTVIAGVGALPRTELAGAAGLTVDDGVVVDGRFRTTDPNIFAAGDCCNFCWRGNRVRLESWKAAQDQGAHAAASMLGASKPYNKVPWFWSDQYELTLQVVGLFDVGIGAVRRKTEINNLILFQCDVNNRLVAAAGIGPGNTVSKEIRIFEKLIERNVIIDVSLIADPTRNLKRLLKTV